MQNHRVGDITVVKCSGRITEGTESAALQQHLNDLFPLQPFIILDLGDVQFIDSSGLGLLVRLLARTERARGSLKLCAVPPNIREVLRVTRLAPIFESHESETDAIAACYQRTKSGGAQHRFRADILCVDASSDVLAYVRQLLTQAGYGVVSTDNLADALMLLKATHPKLVVIGAEMRAASGTRSAEAFNTLAAARAVMELPVDFSSLEAGEAGRQLLDAVRAILPAGNAPPATA
jgi:anti-sigma B factor antagonist